MRSIIHKVKAYRHFLLFILLFAYVQSIYTRTVGRQQINIYTFTPEAAVATLFGVIILFFIISLFIKKWQKHERITATTMLKILVSSLLVFTISMQTIGFLIAWSFGNIERNFNAHALTASLFSNFLDGIIYGSFFLVYSYYQRNRAYQQLLADYNEALAENRIAQLKRQLNPHFLFNNLHILDQLIEEDKDLASDFLNEFAEIYRYVLQSTDKELVPIDEEIAFARLYFGLMQHKYGRKYQLNIAEKQHQGFVVPMTLQLLIENAIQHNLGTVENPIVIDMEVDQAITISNTIQVKRQQKETSGRALNNLQEQYALLSDIPLAIRQTAQRFSVSIPIIQQQDQ